MGNTSSNGLSTSLAKSTDSDDNIIKIKVKTEEFLRDKPRFKESFAVYCLYSNQEKLHHIYAIIEQHLHRKYYPTYFKVKLCDDKTSFTEFFSVGAQSITSWDKQKIINKGLKVFVTVQYEHKVNCISIECEYMNKLKSATASDCPIYYAMKEKYDFSEENLSHLNEFNHFIKEYESKLPCKYGQECKSYIRLETGTGNDKLADRCHMNIYRHPPRQRHIALQENIHSLIMNKKRKKNKALHEPDVLNYKKYGHNKKDGFLNMLVQEVIANGFKYDLCLTCGKEDECKHEQYPILQIVDQKMSCHRHKAMGSPLNRAQMLSLILYTGCDCNYDLCSEQRKGNYRKWKWFDYCLYKAIWKLSTREKGDFMVFSGLNGVKLNVKSVNSGYFVTYVSTTWKREISEAFMGGNNGMIIQIDAQYKTTKAIKCCDVSWISKFPDECEILFARSMYDRTSHLMVDEGWGCVVLNDSNGVQTVSLKGKKKVKKSKKKVKTK